MKKLSKQLQAEYDEIIMRLKRHGIELTSDTPALRTLYRNAKTYHHLIECDCNGCTREKYPHESYDQYDKARVKQMEWVEQRKDKVYATIEKAACELNLNFYIQGDPRGGTLYLSKEKLNSQNYHEKGVFIR